MDDHLTPTEHHFITHLPWERTNPLLAQMYQVTSKRKRTPMINQEETRLYLASHSKLSGILLTYYMGMIQEYANRWTSCVLCLPTNFLIPNECLFKVRGTADRPWNYVLFPYHFEQSHWILIYMDMKKKQCRIFDSYNPFLVPDLGTLFHAEPRLLETLFTELTAEPSSSFHVTYHVAYKKVDPEQSDSFSCGVYVAYIAKQIAKAIVDSTAAIAKPFGIDQSSVSTHCPPMDTYRHHMIWECYMGKVCDVVVVE